MEINKKTDKYLQKDASKDVNRGQIMDASDSTPQPFNSRDTI